ncbi:unnamed protein product [Callosobruchus maculatus]|uniref:Uncharacterized protein n=1 Tax=Callosobruchus maculatus TaxID=64391 RepID=A0A653DWL9_CALMS|nr:unnamed protein product [Callosobruchus maculatus]
MPHLLLASIGRQERGCSLVLLCQSTGLTVPQETFPICCATFCGSLCVRRALRSDLGVWWQTASLNGSSEDTF